MGIAPAVQGMPAEVFPVGEYLADELEARGWSIREFAGIIGRPAQAVSEIINGRKEMTAETAFELAAATGTDPGTWLRLQDSYKVWQLAHDSRMSSKTSQVQRKARLSELLPIRELIARGELTDGDLDTQERSVRDLLGIKSLDEPPRFLVAARRSNIEAEFTPAQLAWIACVHRAASHETVEGYDAEALRSLASGLTQTISTPESLEDLPRQFEQVGVRLVYVPKFKGSKIDGAAFLDGSPTIALAGRIQAMDSVLFTLLHESAHLFLKHVGLHLDEDLARREASEIEAAADDLAASWALPEEHRIAGTISRAKVITRASALGVHPSVIVGRLHYERVLPWTHLNGLVPSVRRHLETWNPQPIGGRVL